MFLKGQEDDAGAIMEKISTIIIIIITHFIMYY